MNFCIKMIFHYDYVSAYNNNNNNNFIETRLQDTIGKQ